MDEQKFDLWLQQEFPTDTPHRVVSPEEYQQYLKDNGLDGPDVFMLPRGAPEPLEKGQVLTPWGASQTREVLAEGIEWFTTSGHGGIRLSEERMLQMPPDDRNEGGWYEEDFDRTLVIFHFPQYFSPEEVKDAQETWGEQNDESAGEETKS